MTSQKIQVKVFVTGQVNAVEFAPVFQRWIRDHVLDELLIDVVDYSHVFEGPELALIGHESDYVLDRAGGKLGLLYANKRAPDENGNPFVLPLRRALHACKLLQSENATTTPLAFTPQELQVRIADRLNAPNTDETLQRVTPALREALAQLYGDTPVTLERIGNARELFTVHVRVPGAPALNDIAA